MGSIKMRNVFKGMTLGAVLAMAWHAPAKADDIVPVTDDGTCHEIKVPYEIVPGSGTLTFQASEKCAFQATGAKMPKVWKGGVAQPVTVASDRKTFSAPYDFPSDKNACLQYAFTLTPANEPNKPLEPASGYLCNGVN